MSEIRVCRPSAFKQKFLQWEVVVDGTKVGTIADGQQQTYEVGPGKHRVHVRVGPMISQEVILSISRGDCKVLDCGVQNSIDDYRWQHGLLGLGVTGAMIGALYLAPQHIEAIGIFLFAVTVTGAATISARAKRKMLSPGGMYFLRERTGIG